MEPVENFGQSEYHLLTLIPSLWTTLSLTRLSAFLSARSTSSLPYFLANWRFTWTRGSSQGAVLKCRSTSWEYFCLSRQQLGCSTYLLQLMDIRAVGRPDDGVHRGLQVLRALLLRIDQARALGGHGMKPDVLNEATADMLRDSAAKQVHMEHLPRAIGRRSAR